mgnify:FL=1
MSKLSQLMAAHMALLSATACHKNPFGIEYYRRKDDYGSVPTDKQQCLPKEQHEFTIKGVKIIASSKKDAIKKYNHRKK